MEELEQTMEEGDKLGLWVLLLMCCTGAKGWDQQLLLAACCWEQRQLVAGQHFLRAGAFGGHARRGGGCSWPARRAVPSSSASLCLQLVTVQLPDMSYLLPQCG